MTDEKLFSESGWIITDKDLPPKRSEKKVAKEVTTSADKYLSKPVKSVESQDQQKQPEVKKMDKDKEKTKGKDNALRVMVIGAHPDDADYLCGGLTLLLAKQGHKVKLVAVTNGNMGHHIKSPEEIAFIRSREAVNSAVALGAEYECLGVPDGHVYLMRKYSKSG